MRGTIPGQHQHSAAHKERQDVEWKKTKHIKAKFFFIKDRVDDREIKVIDCPTEEMWADIMTKPLQGTAFRVMRAELMNCDVNNEDPPEDKVAQPICGPKTVSWKNVIATPFKTPQECVGQNGNRRICQETDRRTGRNLGIARLVAPTWQGGAAKKGKGRE